LKFGANVSASERGFDYLLWTFDEPQRGDPSSSANGVAHFGFYANPDGNKPDERITILVGSVPGEARITVSNYDGRGIKGTLNASFTVVVKDWEVPDQVIPSAFLIQEGTNYQFAINWKSLEGQSEKEIATSLEQTFETWLDYKIRINPLPFYYKGHGFPTDDTAFRVFTSNGSGAKLDNSNPSVDGSIVINRYWPSGLTSRTVAEWRSAENQRRTAFYQEVTDIRNLMEKMRLSAYYNMEVNGRQLLHLLYDSMEIFIDYCPPYEQITTRTGFSFSTDSDRPKALLPDGETGHLFEYYMGYVPTSVDYTDPSGPLVFPE
jgi:hypothetical protein